MAFAFPKYFPDNICMMAFKGFTKECSFFVKIVQAVFALRKWCYEDAVTLLESKKEHATNKAWLIWWFDNFFSLYEKSFRPALFVRANGHYYY